MDVKLQIDRNVGACCDSESTRCSIGNVRLHDQWGQVYATATNGKCLTVCPLEGKIDEPCLMPADAVPTVKAGGQVIGNGEWRTRTGTKKIKERVTEGAIDGSRFPHVRKVLEVADKTAPVAIVIDPSLLAKMGKALTDEEKPGLTLLIRPDDVDGPIRVIGEHGIGVLMPMSQEKGAHYFARYDAAVKAYGQPD